MKLDGVRARIPANDLQTGTARPASRDFARILDATKQFEALLLAEMLKSMREASGGSCFGAGEDAAADSAMALAQEQFAQALAQNGGLGLSKLLVTPLLNSERSSG
jgi:Rod binding domain-containing protein